MVHKDQEKALLGLCLKGTGPDSISDIRVNSCFGVLLKGSKMGRKNAWTETFWYEKLLDYCILSKVNPKVTFNPIRKVGFLCQYS